MRSLDKAWLGSRKSINQKKATDGPNLIPNSSYPKGLLLTYDVIVGDDNGDQVVTSSTFDKLG